MVPFQCGGSYTGYDLAGNGLFTETAIEYVNAAQVHEGTSFVVASMTGGTAAPDISVGSSVYVYLVWTDTVTVGGLPIGTPIQLQVTDYTPSSNLQLLASLGSQLNDQVYLMPSGSGSGLSCSAAQFENLYTTTTFGINPNQKVDVCATSGETFTLTKILTVSLEAGNSDGYSGFATMQQTAYIDSLTPGVTVSSVSGATYATPGGVPTLPTACNGEFSGNYAGNIKVSSGQTCVFNGGNITGHVTQTGGQLILTNTGVGGNVTITGGAFTLGPFTTIGGNLKVNGVQASTDTNDVCGTTVTGNMELENVGATLNIGSSSPTCTGNSIGGHLLVKDNSGLTNIYDNFVTDNLHVESETGSTQVYNNNVGKDLLLDTNSGSTAVFNNTVVNNLNCATNSSISGGGNTAKKKLGECASF